MKKLCTQTGVWLLKLILFRKGVTDMIHTLNNSLWSVEDQGRITNGNKQCTAGCICVYTEKPQDCCWSLKMVKTLDVSANVKINFWCPSFMHCITSTLCFPIIYSVLILSRNGTNSLEIFFISVFNMIYSTSKGNKDTGITFSHSNFWCKYLMWQLC